MPTEEADRLHAELRDGAIHKFAAADFVNGIVADCHYYYCCSAEAVLVPAAAACGAHWPYWTPPPAGHTA